MQLRAFIGLMAISLSTTVTAEERDLTARNGVRIETSFDEYSYGRRYASPTIKQSDGTMDYETYYLVTYVDRAGRTTYHLSVTIHYAGDWRFYRSARLPGPVELGVGDVDRKVERCTPQICLHSERVFIDLPAATMARAASGAAIAVKITSDDGDAVLIDVEPHHAVALRQYAGVLSPK